MDSKILQKIKQKNPMTIVAWKIYWIEINDDIFFIFQINLLSMSYLFRIVLFFFSFESFFTFFLTHSCYIQSFYFCFSFIQHLTIFVMITSRLFFIFVRHFRIYFQFTLSNLQKSNKRRGDVQNVKKKSNKLKNEKLWMNVRRKSEHL